MNKRSPYYTAGAYFNVLVFVSCSFKYFLRLLSDLAQHGGATLWAIGESTSEWKWLDNSVFRTMEAHEDNGSVSFLTLFSEFRTVRAHAGEGVLIEGVNECTPLLSHPLFL
jgi:hypothetical protein